MSAETIQAQYDHLATIAQRFANSAQANADMIGRVQRSAQALQQGGWQGKGSEAFSAEMTRTVFPALQRLTQALQEAQATTLRISEVLRQAEDEAAKPFRAGGTAIDQTPGLAASITPEGINDEFDRFKLNRPPRSPVTTYPTEGVAAAIAQLLGMSAQQITQHEANLLNQLNLLQLGDFRNIHDQAFEYEAAYFGGNPNNDGPADAFRHAVWSALLTRQFTADWAQEYTGAHEDLPGNRRRGSSWIARTTP